VIGISIGTLRRADKELKIIPTRKGFGGVGIGKGDLLIWLRGPATGPVYGSVSGS